MPSAGWSTWQVSPPVAWCWSSEIARAMDVPPMFLAKIFQQFSKLGLVRSFRGQRRRLSARPHPGGNHALRDRRGRGRTDHAEPLCDVRWGLQPAKVCTVHPVWKKVQANVRDILSGVTLKDLSADKVRMQ